MNWRFWQGSVVRAISVPHECDLSYLLRRKYPLGTIARCPMCGQLWELKREFASTAWTRVEGEGSDS